MNFEGIYTPVITPHREDDDLDFDFDKEYAYDGGEETDDSAEDDYEKEGAQEQSDAFDDGSSYNDIPDDRGSSDDDY